VCIYVFVADGFLVVLQPENLIIRILLGDLVDLRDRLFHLQGVYVNLVALLVLEPGKVTSLVRVCGF
jgi:hypothetical protein